jgi:protein gp37
MNDKRFHWVKDFTEPQETKGFMKAVHRREATTFFVGDLCDLFGDWVSDNLIQRVFDECAAYKQHTYLFLTKNPERYRYVNIGRDELDEEEIAAGKKPLELYDTPMWLGASATNNEQLERAYKSPAVWLSIEPLHEELNTEEMFSYTDRYVQDDVARWAGVIIGAETGDGADKIMPKREWIDEIVETCDFWKIPVFMKDSLITIVGAKNMRRELPWKVGARI